jgi:inorganic triphosphatase YgiF
MPDSWGLRIVTGLPNAGHDEFWLDAATINPMPLERELKLTGTLPNLEGVTEIAGFPLSFQRVERQTNTYFDTADLRLRNAGMSLRLRQLEGEPGVYTWKGRSSVLDGWHAKSELVVSAGNATGLEGLDDAEILARVSSVAALGELEARFSLKTVRRVYWLTGIGELALDDVKILEAHGSVADEFSELELEVKEAVSDADLERVEAALRAFPNLEPSALSKSARAARVLGR